MPIRPENRDRYPADWKAISLRIRARAGQKCEWCNAPNGELIDRSRDGSSYMLMDGQVFDAETGGALGYARGSEWPSCGKLTKVILTVAHLGLPPHLPLFLHVTRNAVTDEVIDLVGLIMPLDTEGPEWRYMMHDRATAEFLGCPPASGAGFFVSLPSCSSRGSPRRSVIAGAETSAPIWVRLANWRQLAKPGETALVPAKAPPVGDIESADAIRAAASLTGRYSQAALRRAYAFIATGHRTSFSAISSLLRCEWKPNPANDTAGFGVAFPGSGHAALYHIDDYPENCADENLKALCQRCHNRYDMPMRKAGIKERARMNLAAGDLFATPTTQEGPKP